MEAFVSNTLGTSLIRTVADFPEDYSQDVGESVANTLIKLGALKIVAGQKDPINIAMLKIMITRPKTKFRASPFVKSHWQSSNFGSFDKN